jgi:hypothetical protein
MPIRWQSHDDSRTCLVRYHGRQGVYTMLTMITTDPPPRAMLSDPCRYPYPHVRTPRLACPHVIRLRLCGRPSRKAASLQPPRKILGVTQERSQKKLEAAELNSYNIKILL